MSLTDFRTLGRSGLVVGPAALGTMTFGRTGWGSPEADGKAVFDAYVDAGGLVVDTADVWSGGRSEELVGAFVAERGLRDRLVLATKSGFSGETGNPLAGGNGAKNIHRALHGSPRRLRTDYVDLYWMRAFDAATPVEEVLDTLGKPPARRQDPPSASPTCPPGTSPAPPSWRRRTACRRRSRCSCSTRWWRAASSASTCRRPANAASASCRGARSPAS